MVDRELSRAVEAYLLRLWPHERREGVITLGDDTASAIASASFEGNLPNGSVSLAGRLATER